MKFEIRKEQPEDIGQIADLLLQAFAFDAHSQQNENEILQRLRESQALLLSLVAVIPDGEVVGQIAFSPVEINDGTPGGIHNWVALGPMAVNPRLQRMGIGRQLIEAGLDQIHDRNAAGCVVLGEPGFYERFGFAADENLILPGVPAPFFLAKAFRGGVPQGQVHYHRAFRGD